MRSPDQKGIEFLPNQDRYRPIAKLGSGGMADVFLGVQIGEQGFERLLVIKKVHARGLKNDSAIQMFIDEARVIASLNHPHIVKVFDLSRVRDQICITMEYIDGENLDFMLRSLKNAKKIFPLPIVCKLMIEACEALHYAHTVRSPDGTALNLVHRDIGAQNLMIDSQGYLKVIDFGIAKSTVQTEFTLPGLIKGKLSYLAPDVFKFKDIDGRVDLYALGLVLYELVTMKRPFSFSSETTMAEILNSILQDPIRPPTGINPSVLPDLEKIIYKATDKDRDRRYQTGEDFARALYDFSNKHEGIATTLEVKNWYQTEFKQRIEQRHRFEQQVQEKANRIKKKISDSGIMPIPPIMAPAKKAAFSSDNHQIPAQHVPVQQLPVQQLPVQQLPAQQLPVQPTDPGITSKRKIPYLAVAAALLVFVGGIVLVNQLFFKSSRDEREITLAPSTGQSQTSQTPSQPKPTPPVDAQPKPSPTPVTTAPSPASVLMPAPVPAPAVAPPSPQAADRDSKVALVGKPTVPPKAAVVPPKAPAVVKKPIYQPPPRRRPNTRTNDANVEYIDNTSASAEKTDVETTSTLASAVSVPATHPAPPEKTEPDSTVAMAELQKMDKPGAPAEKSVAATGNKNPSNQPGSESKKTVAVATVNLVSGNGNWSGEQVAARGCTHCHPIDWDKKTKSQWQHFLSRGLHTKTRDLSLYFSKGELSRLLGFISSKEEDNKQPRGLAGTH